ncbi:MAG: ferredoxin [Rhodobacteraceae bacterium]|nr:ferredoxin [Paracoccaceae bacterium]
MSAPDLAAIGHRLRAEGLAILGGFHPEPGEPDLPPGSATLLLLGPHEPGFWARFTAGAEWRDGRPDPLDRWSRRVIGRIACDLGAKALFPFTGPPWLPFLSWAQRSGRAWPSPVRLLVHDRAGLMVSFRGALALKERLDLPPPPAAPPCATCAGQPCRSACPAGALTDAGYDVPACHAFLDTPAGAGCMGLGCAVRRACPVSQAYGRLPEQSAYHMRRFHP